NRPCGTAVGLIQVREIGGKFDFLHQLIHVFAAIEPRHYGFAYIGLDGFGERAMVGGFSGYLTRHAGSASRGVCNWVLKPIRRGKSP
ncbi:MAG: hypothetical protein ACI8W3_002880, partial [Myxococcota bacterium]